MLLFMFCATYSLSDNVVITKIFPTSKLGDDPSFFEQPFDSTIWWNPLIFLRIMPVFSGSIKYPLCFIKWLWWWGEGLKPLAAAQRFWYSKQAPELSRRTCGRKLQGWGCCGRKWLQAAPYAVWGYSVDSSSPLARKTESNSSGVWWRLEMTHS